MPARAHQRLVSLAYIPVQRHIIEKHSTGRLADATFAFQRRPTPLGVWHFAICFGVRSLSGHGLAHRRVEMLLIPELRANRIFLKHVHMIKAFHGHVTLVLHNRSVRAFQIRKAGPSARLDACRFGLRDLRLGQSEQAAGAWPGIAADEHRAAFVGRVERQEFHFFALLLQREIFAHIHDMPAEVPDRGLRLDRRRRTDPGEENVNFARFERWETSDARPGRARELLHVKFNRRIRIHRIEVKMMEARRWKRLCLSLRLGSTDRRESHAGNCGQQQDSILHEIVLGSGIGPYRLQWRPCKPYASGTLASIAGMKGNGLPRYSGAGEEEEGGTHSSVICGSTSKRLGTVALTNWKGVSSPEVMTWPKSAGFPPCPCP